MNLEHLIVPESKELLQKKKKTHHTLLATYQRALGQLKSSQWPKMEQSEQQNSTVYWIRVIVV